MGVDGVGWIQSWGQLTSKYKINSIKWQQNEQLNRKKLKIFKQKFKRKCCKRPWKHQIICERHWWYVWNPTKTITIFKPLKGQEYNQHN